MLGGYGEFMYQTGLIDENQKQYVVQQTDYGVKLIQQQKWVEAFRVRDAECLLHLGECKMNDHLSVFSIVKQVLVTNAAHIMKRASTVWNQSKSTTGMWTCVFRFSIACWMVIWIRIPRSIETLQAAPTTSTTWRVRYSDLISVCVWHLRTKPVLSMRTQKRLSLDKHELPVCAPQEPEDQEYFSQFVTLAAVRRAIHVGNLTFNDGSKVEKHLLQDVMKSIKPWLGVLMDNYRVSDGELPTAVCLQLLYVSMIYHGFFPSGLNLQWSVRCHCSCSPDGEVPAYCELDRGCWVQNSCALPLEGSAQWHRGGGLCETSERVCPGETVFTRTVHLTWK